MIRWGILGSGNIAKKFAADLLLVENAELAAIGSRSKEKASEFVKEYPVSSSDIVNRRPFIPI